MEVRIWRQGLWGRCIIVAVAMVSVGPLVVGIQECSGWPLGSAGEEGPAGASEWE